MIMNTALRSMWVQGVVGLLLLAVEVGLVSGQVVQPYSPITYPHINVTGQLQSSQWYFNGNYYTTCFPSGNDTVQCSGYLYRDASGCVPLVVPVETWVNEPGNMVTAAIQCYTLHNLPTSYPPLGDWVKVTGQLFVGYNASPNGEASPGNYINVSSIS